MDQVTVKTRSNTSQAIFVSNRSMAISNTGDVLTQNEALEIVAIHDGQVSVLDTCATGDEVFNKIMLSGDNKIAYWRCDSRVRGAAKVDGQYVGKTVTVGGGAYPLDYDFAISAKNGRAFNLDKATGGSLQGRSRVGVYNEETERFSQVVLPEEYNSYMVRSFSADGSHALIQYGANNPKLILIPLKQRHFKKVKLNLRLTHIM